MTNSLPPSSLPAGGPELNVEELAPLWGISEYTLREWAGQGLIPGALQRGGRWRFPAQPRLKAPVRPGADIGTDFQLVDLGAYPLTPHAVAFRWHCAEATIRSWARAGRMRPRVWLPRGWRFADRVKLASEPAPRRRGRRGGLPEGRTGDGEAHGGAIAPAPEAPNAPAPLRALAALRYQALRRGAPR
ncbi:MAG: helix-turn-helix domain-containing protein [Gemmatimonadaceae bacterium]|nr:helix-turn-helix domain-containing protein [Gemmatimonadaceae bacterium]